MSDARALLLRLARSAPTDDAALRAAALALGLRLRRVRLRRRAWWRQDQGPLLAFRRDGRALVLEPDGRGGTRALDPAVDAALDPAAGPGVPLDAALAERLSDAAYAPYRRAGAAPLSASVWRRLAQAGGGRERAVEWAAALGAGLSALVPALALPVFGRMLEAGDRSGIVAVMAALLLAALAGALFEHARRVASARAAALADLNRHAGLWDRLLALPPWLLRNGPPALAEGLRDGMGALHHADAARAATRRALPRLLPALAAMGGLAPLPALAGAALLAAGTAIRVALLRRADHVRRAGETAAPDTRRRLELASQAMPQLRLLGAESWAVNAARDGLAGGTARRRRVAERLADAGAVGHALALGTPLLAGGLALAQDGGVAIAGAVALAAVPAVHAARDLAEALGRLPLGNRLAPLRPLLEAAPDSPPGAPVLARIETLALRDVTFTHPGAPSPCLRGVALTLSRGEILAVGGPSGSGKTTLLSLALGLAWPDSGAVLVNGRDLAGLDADAFRARVGAVMQDEGIGVSTVRSVILGMAPLPVERAWEAARLARLDADIAALPMGIQTLVAEGCFPAGLVQRLLIARALAPSPDLLVLDEATAALDEDIQAALFADLRRLGVAVLVASHRPSTLALADRVLDLSRR